MNHSFRSYFIHRNAILNTYALLANKINRHPVRINKKKKTNKRSVCPRILNVRTSATVFKHMFSNKRRVQKVYCNKPTKITLRTNVTAFKLSAV